MRKRLRKGIAVLLMAAVFTGAAMPVSVLAANTITISSKEEFLAFAKNCTLDRWSAGKTVTLTCDIDLKHTGFSSIPIFSGTFDGQGHTVSGIKLQKDGSNIGLFRYIEAEGVVKNLNVVGEISPGGTKMNIGGIVGENNGVIENCTFDGNVAGKTNVGGIAGRNGENGEIRLCTVSGEIDGVLAAGGIVGENKGFLRQCKNRAAVNTEYKEAESDVSNLDLDTAALLENYKIKKEESERDTLDHTDIGGIVGATTGIVQGCINEGEVGYPHTGYNVGGIAGRQSGYLLGCENYGAVFGRKDVGGIVGQAEPYLWLSASEDTMDTIRAEFETLRDMADRLGDDTEGIGDRAEACLDSLSDHSGQAGDYAKEMKEYLKSFVKDNEAELDAWTAELSDISDDLEDAADDLSDGMGDLGDGLEDLRDALALLRKDAPEIEEITKILQEIENIQQAEENLQVQKAQLETLLKQLVQDILAKDKTHAMEVLAQMVSVVQSAEPDIAAIQSSLRTIRTLRSTLPDSIKDAADVVNHRWKKALNRADDALDDIFSAGDTIADAMEAIGDVVSDFVDAAPEFVKLDDAFEASEEGLSDSIEAISDDMDALRLLMKDSRQTLAADIESITDQFERILELLFDEVDALRNGTDEEDIFLDVSDTEIEQTRQGKIAGSHNYGTIEGDRNIGGIAGAMSIDLSAAPEADIEKPDSLRFTYRMKVILQNCVNEGDITGKKDCIGGVAGYNEIGTIYQCETYGAVESTNGNYVGGIAGKSDGTLRKCYAKGEITGGMYIGGIAGKAVSVSDSCAIAAASGDETIGAVLGSAEKLDSLHRNYFVEQEIGAVDGISYQGKAEPISYQQMREMTDAPDRFICFKATFLAEDEVVAEQEIFYGDATASIKLPDIPEKQGYYGTWQPFAEETVTGDIRVECEYHPYDTVISSMEKNESGKLSLALAEGEFTNQAELHIFENDTEEAPKAAVGRTVLYDIILEDENLDASQPVTLRLLNEKKEKVSIWQKNGTEWTELTVKDRGKYVVCEMDGAEGTLCLRYVEGTRVMMFVLPVCIAAGGVLVFVLKRKGIGRRKKKTQETEKND